MLIRMPMPIKVHYWHIILAWALLGPSSLLAQVLPTIRAVVGRPVLQELMGGCSLRCAFPWTTTAILPGRTRQPVYALDDCDASTAWIDPNPTVGTKLEFRFPAKLPTELNDTPFYGFDTVSGVIRPIENFKAYSRIKKAKVWYNGKPLFYVVFSDTPRWQSVTFEDIMARQGDLLAIEILEVYPGQKSPNVAITEVVLQGAH